MVLIQMREDQKSSPELSASEPPQTPLPRMPSKKDSFRGYLRSHRLPQPHRLCILGSNQRSPAVPLPQSSFEPSGMWRCAILIILPPIIRLLIDME